MRTYDWSYLQSFVAVAEHGSLSAAARARRTSQPTLSRHIGLLEEQTGARLFDREPSGMVLTDRGNSLFAHAAKMADAAAQASLAVQGAKDPLTGTVRLTASQIVATYLLPPVLTDLHARYPGIEIEVVASDDTNNLLRREADIAVRMYRPTQKDVIAKQIGALKLGAYASKSYIARRGMPHGTEDLLTHDLIDYDRSTLIIDGLAALGLQVDRSFFKFRSDDQVVCWRMVEAGFGIGFNQARVAEPDPEMVKIAGTDMVGTLPIWLTAHPEVRQIPRIRRVFDFLSAGIPAAL
ncbi:MAG: LysR family transcriptional regulator [Pseudomonadota bacterium]